MGGILLQRPPFSLLSSLSYADEMVTPGAGRTNTRRPGPRVRTLWLCIGLVFWTAAPGHAQDAPVDPTASQPLHWAFGSFLGTGVYRISDERSAFVLKIPARWALSHSAMGQDGERRLGLELRFPLTLGMLQSKTLGGYRNQDTYGTFAITPGLEVEIPVVRGWLLRPSFAIGWGKELGPNDDPAVNQSALIYQVGLKSRVHLPIEFGTWGLLTFVQYAGYNPTVGPSGDLLLVTGGLETRQRLFHLFNGPNPLFFETHATYNYVTALDKLRNGDAPPIDVGDFWEVGFAISQGVVPYRIFRIFPIERFGLAFQLSTDTDYRAIKLSFRSPFRM